MKLTDEQYLILRLWCQWNLGDADWAAGIADALGNPAETKRTIIEQMKED